MNADSIATLVGSLGFPIVACGFLAWYVMKLTSENSKEINDMRREHQEEIKKVTEALNNNTLALQRLCDRIDREVTHV